MFRKLHGHEKTAVQFQRRARSAGKVFLVCYLLFSGTCLKKVFYGEIVFLCTVHSLPVENCRIRIAYITAKKGDFFIFQEKC